MVSAELSADGGQSKDAGPPNEEMYVTTHAVLCFPLGLMSSG